MSCVKALTVFFYLPHCYGHGHPKKKIYIYIYIATRWSSSLLALAKVKRIGWRKNKIKICFIYNVTGDVFVFLLYVRPYIMCPCMRIEIHTPHENPIVKEWRFWHHLVLSYYLNAHLSLICHMGKVYRIILSYLV